MAEIFKSYTTERFLVKFKVEEKQAGLRLDQFVLSLFPSFSREAIKRKIALGEITIEKRPTPHRPSVKVAKDEIVTFITYKKDIKNEFWQGAEIELEKEVKVLFDDKKLLAISKPPFMATHPAGKHLFYTATVYFETKLNSTVYSIHRIDRETSGVLLLAQDFATASKLSIAFEENKIKKVYFFIARKNYDENLAFPFFARENLGRVDANEEIDEDNEDLRLLVKAYPENGSLGKKAQTFFYKVLENENYLLGLAFPKTGRQHQIRAHAAHHHFPLLGDKLYLGDIHLFGRFKDRLATTEDHELMQIPRQALHAFYLEIPYLGEVLKIKAPIPPDLMEWSEKNFNLEQIDLEKKLSEAIDHCFNNFLR